MKRAMSNLFSHRKMTIGEFHVAIEIQNFRHMKYILLLLSLIFTISIAAIELPVTLQIAVTSDVHGTILPYDFINNKTPDGSMSKVCAYAKRMRQNKDTAFILLDNGDILQGQPIMDYYNQIKTDKLHICAQIMNYVGFDAASVGNHDIECGHSVYDKLREQYHFPWLAGNAIDTLSQQPFFKPYTIIERNGARIAVIGLITPGIPQWLPQTLWSGLRFDDMIETASRLMKEVKEKYHPDVIIGLFHSGLNPTYGGQTASQRFNENAAGLIAFQVPGFDAVIAGHDHKATTYSVVNSDKKNVVIVNPGSHSTNLGIINLQITKTGNTATGKLLGLKNMPDDEVYNRFFAPQIAEVRQYLGQRVGYLSETLRTNDALFGDCDFIDLIHQVQLQYSGADISFAEPTGLNVKVDSGAIFLNDLFNIYKYSNTLYTIQLTGEEVDRFLEYSYGEWLNQMTSANDHLLKLDKNNRLIANVYNLTSAEGIQYTVDVTRTAGDRVTISRFNDGRPFDVNATYKVALSSYRANGGGGHLTRGVGIQSDDLPKRVLTISKEDYRFLLKDFLEQPNHTSNFKNNNWDIVPREWINVAKEKDAKALSLRN